MKYIFIISFFLPGFSFSQEITIGSESSLFFYKGYSHKIEVNNPKRKKIQVSCVDCDTIYLHNKELNQYLVKVDTVDQIKILIHSKNGKLIESKVFPCVSIPEPIVYIDDIRENSGLLNKVPEKIVLKRTETTITFANFLVVKWIIRINGKTFKGIGSKLSDELKKEIRLLKKGNFKLELDYFKPTGKEKLITTFYFNLGLPPIKLKE